MPKKPNIKILVSCHKESYVPQNSMLYAIQVGTQETEIKLPAAYYDNQGDHISQKNRSYCELTAQYWAWKNLKADYYGFFHYRRYLSFAKEYPVLNSGKLCCRRWRPYMERGDLKRQWNKCALTEENVTRLAVKYDIITTLREPMNSTVYEQFCQFHQEQDLKDMLRILIRRYPAYRQSVKTYLNARQLYFTNMYLMSKEEFFSYMEWLFPLLEEFEARADFSSYNEHEYRAIGFLAERLFGIYYTHAVRVRKKRCCELQYVIFANTNPWCKVFPAFPAEKQEVTRSFADAARNRKKVMPAKGSVNIAISAGNSYVPYVAALVQSILECRNPGRPYDIMILHTNITLANQQKVAAMQQKQVSIRFCNLTEEVRGIPFRVHQHFTAETFYRYFLPQVLRGYEKVLYLDADMVVMEDVAKLYDIPVDGYLLAAVRDIDVIGLCRADPSMERYVKKKLGMRRVENYFQAGVQLMNLKELRKCYKSADYVEKTLQANWRLLDQDVMNMLCQGRVKYLDQKWNVLMDWQYCGKSRMDLARQAPFALYQQYQRARKAPCVIHYAGTWKPWTDPVCDFSAQFWHYARQTAFYEAILYENAAGTGSRKKESVLETNQHMRVFRLRPTKLEFAVDMKKVNDLLPPGSKRRIAVRCLCKNFL